MKTTSVILWFVFVGVLIAGCGIMQIGQNVKTIPASNTIVSETRTASGFTGINVRTLGQVILSQGDNESVTVKGSDNIVPLIKTSVRDGVLYIETDETVAFTGMNTANMLTFTIMVKDLTSLTVSGLADVQMESLSTTDLAVTMSGAGNLKLNQLKANSMNITLSGLGNVDVAGEVTTATIKISGAGGVNAPDLKIKTATVDIPGLGGAKVWVTDRLTGTISGGGDVSYYGNPQADTKTTGLGSFKSLGSK